jgi:hypothetical protein
MAVAQDVLRRPAAGGAKIHTIIMTSNLNCFHTTSMPLVRPMAQFHARGFVIMMVVVEELNYATVASE